MSDPSLNKWTFLAIAGAIIGLMFVCCVGVGLIALIVAVIA